MDGGKEGGRERWCGVAFPVHLHISMMHYEVQSIKSEISSIGGSVHFYRLPLVLSRSLCFL